MLTICTDEDDVADETELFLRFVTFDKLITQQAQGPTYSGGNSRGRGPPAGINKALLQ
jgi:hypothetical protein